MREWVVYALIMTVVFALFFRDSGMVGAIAGLLVSGPLYLALGFVLAKFGYQRQSIRQIRRERETAATSPDPQTTPRPRPAPTRRTSNGPSNRPRSRKRR